MVKNIVSGPFVSPVGIKIKRKDNIVCYVVYTFGPLRKKNCLGGGGGGGGGGVANNTSADQPMFCKEPYLSLL